MILQGVQGSSLPGFNMTGVFIAIEGIHKALTAGLLDGKITPSALVVGTKATLTPC